MDDRELMERFDDSSIPAEAFGHREHVRVAWLFLRAATFEAAALRFCSGLRRLAASLGKPDRYHETITWAYLALVNERMHVPGAPPDFEVFARANPDLFDQSAGALAAYYDAATLRSPRARAAFVLPRPPGG